MLKDMKIAPKLILCFIIVVLLASSSGIFGTILLNKTDRNYSKALVENGFSQGDIGRFNTYLNKGGAVVRDIILLTDKDDIKGSQNELTDIQNKTTEALDKLKIDCTTKEELEFIKIIDKKLPEYLIYSDKAIALGLENKNIEAIEVFHTEARPILNEVMNAAESLSSINITLGDQVSDSLSKQNRSTNFVIISIIIVATTISIIIAVIVARSIASPIIKVKDAAEKLSRGDLNIQVSVDSMDEVGEMSKSFSSSSAMMRDYIADITNVLTHLAKGNFDISLSQDFKGDFKQIEEALLTIISSLSDTLGQINQAADQVSSGSDQVSSGAQALSQGATEQASSVEELAATINEISGQINSNAQNAASASDKARSVGSEAVGSNQRMQEMLKAMSDISSSSSEIAKIIKTIEDIAFQTNILALNAAVEAARAGAAGKGFAVVADEVRNLATKSSEASQNTASLIESSLRAVENGTKIADETAQSMNAVVDGVKDVSDTIDKISVASNQQAQSVAQVTQGIDQISSVVQTNSATAEESAAASEELSGQAQMLKSLVSQFRLKDTGHTKAPVFKPEKQESDFSTPVYDTGMSSKY